MPKSYFQSQFDVASQKQRIFFSFKNINLGDHFFLKTFFLASIFEALVFIF